MRSDYHVKAEEWDRLLSLPDDELIAYVGKNPNFNNWLVLYARERFTQQMNLKEAKQ